MSKQSNATVATMGIDIGKNPFHVPFEFAAAATGSLWDYPLTSRFDENDAIFVFDNAFIPWENVIIYRDIERLKNFYPRSGFFNGFTLQGCTRLAVKLDFIAGLLYKAARATGVEAFRGVQAQIGEVIGWRNMFWSLSDAMAFNPEPWVNGAVLPNSRASSTYRLFMTEAYPAVRAIVEKVISSGLIYLPPQAPGSRRPGSTARCLNVGTASRARSYLLQHRVGKRGRWRKNVTARLFRSIATVALLLVDQLSVHAESPSFGKVGEPIHLQVGYQPNYAEAWSAIVLDDRRLWTTHLPAGSSVDFVPAPAGLTLITEMVAGKLHVAYVGDIPAILATSRPDLRDIRMIAVPARSRQQCNLLLVRPDAPAFASATDAVRWLDGRSVGTLFNSCSDRFADSLFSRLSVKPGKKFD
jgi:hypothetical protein